MGARGRATKSTARRFDTPQVTQIDRYSRTENLERVAFRKRDPLLGQVGRRSHVDVERLLLGFHREVRSAEATTASTACPSHSLDAFNGTLARRLAFVAWVAEVTVVERT